MADGAPAQQQPWVLVTGASSGLGAALAAACARTGWRVALVGRRAEALQDTAAVCGASARVIVCDLGDRMAWRAAAQSLLADWGCPQVVIANAGISHGVDLRDAADRDVAATIMETNWRGALETLAPFIAPMVERGSGRLVGITSVAGVRGLPGHAAYSASKAALDRSLESLRVDLRGTGVKVVTISPGYVATPMTDGNPFPMPFLISADTFARRALRAIAAGRAYATIPWPMAVASKLLHVLPRAVYDRLAARAGRKPRQGPSRH